MPVLAVNPLDAHAMVASFGAGGVGAILMVLSAAPVALELRRARRA
ncbi:hypothetical protein EDD29_4797 [Actinocorallia herbida]|uniref:Uncharacterized protein n=1 Tax=Actinocorallia herbida TaxID=58109 RepID=A0A3N1D0Z8_9ACTN|nr:hypothetical protein [Actinocorallia herbida]ROO87203.1 hypothetical protein EDD29_4797 [Actinocorallia herbida]